MSKESGDEFGHCECVVRIGFVFEAVVYVVCLTCEARM